MTCFFRYGTRYDNSPRLVARLSIGESFNDPVTGVQVTFQSISCPEQQIATVTLDYCPESWTSCSGASCSSEASETPAPCDLCNANAFISAHGYTGTLNVTLSGLSCQAWTASFPHIHGYAGVGNHNYCRVTDDTGLLWCFTTDPTIEWEYCDTSVVCPEIPGNNFSWSKGDALTAVGNDNEQHRQDCLSLRRGNRPLPPSTCNS